MQQNWKLLAVLILVTQIFCKCRMMLAWTLRIFIIMTGQLKTLVQRVLPALKRMRAGIIYLLAKPAGRLTVPAKKWSGSTTVSWWHFIFDNLMRVKRFFPTVATKGQISETASLRKPFNRQFQCYSVKLSGTVCITFGFENIVMSLISENYGML